MGCPSRFGQTDLTLPLWPLNWPRPWALAVSHRCTHWSPEAVSILASACSWHNSLSEVTALTSTFLKIDCASSSIGTCMVLFVAFQPELSLLSVQRPRLWSPPRLGK